MKVVVGFILGVASLLYVPNIVEKAGVLGIITGGYIIAPEASSIVAHYCFGNGDTLYLDPNYIQQSKVVQQQLSKMKVGETKAIRFHQKEDWRLSYALNPFNITKTKDGAVIHQYIKFRGNDYTYLNILGHKIKVTDNIVHAFECEPYVAICKI